MTGKNKTRGCQEHSDEDSLLCVCVCVCVCVCAHIIVMLLLQHIVDLLKVNI